MLNSGFAAHCVKLNKFFNISKPHSLNLEREASKYYPLRIVSIKYYKAV